MKYLLIFLFLTLYGSMSFGLKPKVNPTNLVNESYKIDALKVLREKCNVCHQTKNPSKVFTIDNMNGFAKRINRQVFLWKRMPKGREVKLTIDEKRTLKTWINNQTNR